MNDLPAPTLLPHRPTNLWLTVALTLTMCAGYPLVHTSSSASLWIIYFCLGSIAILSSIVFECCAIIQRKSEAWTLWKIECLGKRVKIERVLPHERLLWLSPYAEILKVDPATRGTDGRVQILYAREDTVLTSPEEVAGGHLVALLELDRHIDYHERLLKIVRGVRYTLSHEGDVYVDLPDGEGGWERLGEIQVVARQESLLQPN